MYPAMMDSIQFPAIPNENETGTDWVYTMRREMQEILPGLYLGPYAAAMKSKFASLKKAQITHIVCIRQSIEANFVRENFPEHFRYITVDISDAVTENIIRHIPKVKEFLDGCLTQGGKVLVHGNAGISRSAALVVGYIMETYGLPYKVGLQYVQQRRFCINPNEGFAHQLMEYEPIYRAKLTLQNGQPSTEKGLLKRKFIEEEDTNTSDEMDFCS